MSNNDEIYEDNINANEQDCIEEPIKVNEIKCVSKEQEPQKQVEVQQEQFVQPEQFVEQQVPQNNMPPQNSVPPQNYEQQQGYAPPPPQGYYYYAPQQPFYPQQPQKKESGTKKIILGAFMGAITTAFLFTVLYIALFAVPIYTDKPTTDNSYTEDDFKEFYDKFFGGSNFGGSGSYDFGEDENPMDPFGGSADPSLALPEGFIPNPNIEVTPQEEIGLNSKPRKGVLTSEEVYEKVNKSTVVIEAYVPTGITEGEYFGGIGTGVLISSDGYIITNSHVVGDTVDAVVRITDYKGNTYPAVVVGVDRGTDLAVVKTEDHNFTPAELGNSDQLNIGETVYAIGNPQSINYSGTFTDGMVSGLNRELSYGTKEGMKYIQTNTAINPGNSGGPLINSYGQVIGLNVSKVALVEYEGLGFAIPITNAKEIIDQLLDKGYVANRVRLGITAQNNANGGVKIIEIAEDSSFAGTEIEVGDIITAVGDYVVSEIADLSTIFLSYTPGDVVSVTVVKPDGHELEVDITLIADNGETQKK